MRLRWRDGARVGVELVVIDNILLWIMIMITVGLFKNFILFKITKNPNNYTIMASEEIQTHQSNCLFN